VLIGVISDLHSNCFALEAVLQELLEERPDEVLLLGDAFGYYPWAVETYDLLREHVSFAVLGNHDALLLDETPPDPLPGYWGVAQANRRSLLLERCRALEWLDSLRPELELSRCDCKLRCVHGTPEEPLIGRFYPDDPRLPAWMPEEREVLLMGHTHYPIVRKVPAGGLVLNPGSVGQPRDTDPRASWALLSLPECRATVRRTEYDIRHVIRLLEEMNWYSVAVSSLKKRLQ
jgi:predicted phosphodiesterase